MSAGEPIRYLIRVPATGRPGGADGLAVLAAAADGALVELSLRTSGAAARAAMPGCVELPSGCAELPADGPPPLLEARRQLAEYFAGDRRAFTLPLAPRGTEFERLVWQALVAIPYGETRSYAEVAAAIGRPAACRAVGRANGSNPIAIVIPCHRVIGSDGSLTGFGGGLPLKRFLLDLESGNGTGAAPPPGGATQRPLPLAR
jgi:methylated-DNA-[protein]-cysteine S-methyltransferase